MERAPTWNEETLFTNGDEYFAGLLSAIDVANHVIEFETYIYEKGVIGDRMADHLIRASQRGVRVRVIVDGWGSPGFVHDYWPAFKAAGIRVRFFRVTPWLMKRVPGDPKSFRRRIVHRWARANFGNHRKFCVIDKKELWAGSFNVSDVHLKEVNGDQAWKDAGVRVVGDDIRYAIRAFQRAFRGWRAINLPARSPKLLLLNDSYLHKRRARVQYIKRMRHAEKRIWISTPYFAPIGRVIRILRRQAKRGLDVRVMVPRKNDVWVMRWISIPILHALAKRGVKVFIYEPRFSHQKVLIADDWVCIGSTNLNHRSFLHDLEMDVVLTRDENRKRMIDGYVRDQGASEVFDTSDWADLPFWERILSSIFMWAKYWS
jgi:cardiolipin synthase A/B